MAEGHSGAQNNLAVLYEGGLGGEQDYAKARELYEQAAAQGIVRAYYHLGEMYEYGRGVEKDYAKAREYYETAAAKGDKDAQKKLTEIHEQYITEGTNSNSPPTP